MTYQNEPNPLFDDPKFDAVNRHWRGAMQGVSDSLNALLTELKDADPSVRFECASALRDVLDLLTRLELSCVVEAVTCALANETNAKVSPELIALLTDARAKLRERYSS